MQINENKCRELQRNAEKCREMQGNAGKCKEMQRNAEKCREMYRNAEKFREMHICRDILMTFMTLIMIFMIHCNVIFDILEPLHLRNIAHVVGSYRNLKNLVEFGINWCLLAWSI